MVVTQVSPVIGAVTEDDTADITMNAVAPDARGTDWFGLDSRRLPLSGAQYSLSLSLGRSTNNAKNQ
eukprot:9492311-Pyramimonas_sp.AAC.2